MLQKAIQEYINTGKANSGNNTSAYSRHSNIAIGLTQTRYGFNKMEVDGEVCSMYNSPYETAQTLINRQGNNTRNAAGVCGVCQCANILRMAGISDVTEEDVLNTAMTCSPGVVQGLDINNADSEERGGTSSSGRREILARYGVDSYTLPIQQDRAESVEQLSQAIRTGHGVIVSVDAGRLWNDSRYDGGGHAISLISVSENGDRFIYSDTGAGRIGTISAQELGNVLSGRTANITTRIIR